MYLNYLYYLSLFVKFFIYLFKIPTSSKKMTPLHYAAMSGNEATVRGLIAVGANIQHLNFQLRYFEAILFM